MTADTRVRPAGPAVVADGPGLVGEIVAVLGEHGLRLRKIVPVAVDGPDEGLLIEAAPTRSGGTAEAERAAETGGAAETAGVAGGEPWPAVVAGRWHPDPATTRRIARRLGAEGAVLRLGGRLLLQRGGADHRLPALRAALAGPGATLVAHRSGKRAVVADAAGYLKVLRPGRATGMAAALADAARGTGQGVDPGDGFATPAVLAVDPVADTVRMAALPGTTLHDRLGDAGVGDGDLIDDLTRIGRSLRAWHDSEPVTPEPTGVPPATHDLDAEVSVTRSWIGAASAYRLLPVPAAVLLARVDHLRPTRPERITPQPAHRDLHDKQLLIAPDAPVGLLDLDLAALADPALDLANLLVHLDLRALQGHCPTRRAALAQQALLDGYRPDDALTRRLATYQALTALRLAAVYGFRRAAPPVLAGLLGLAPR